MSDTAALWEKVNDLRVAQAEAAEREKALMKTVEDMSAKVSTMHTMVMEAQGAKKLAMFFGKFGYGFWGAASMGIYAYWPSFKKLFA